MTQDEIIRMAQTCGFIREDHHAIYGMLARFAELVAAAIRARGNTRDSPLLHPSASSASS